MKRTPHTSLLPLLALALLACDAASPEESDSDGLYAEFAVTAEGGTKSAVSATLKRGGAGSLHLVELPEGDELRVTAAGETRQLEQSIGLGFVPYTAKMSTVAPGTEFRIALVRADPADPGAPSSTCTLPAPFEITGPAADAAFSRAADALTITWSGGGETDRFEVDISGVCIETFHTEVDADGGELALPAGTLQLEPDSVRGETTCTAYISLRRWRDGAVDPGFDAGGTMWCQQARRVEVTTAP